MPQQQRHNFLVQHRVGGIVQGELDRYYRKRGRVRVATRADLEKAFAVATDALQSEGLMRKNGALTKKGQAKAREIRGKRAAKKITERYERMLRDARGGSLKERLPRQNLEQVRDLGRVAKAVKADASAIGRALKAAVKEIGCKGRRS